jgi:predicted deacylase
MSRTGQVQWVALVLVLAASNGCGPEQGEAPGAPAGGKVDETAGEDAELGGSRLAYFPGSYDEARQSFGDLCAGLQSAYTQVQAEPIPVASSTDADLTIDTCTIPAQGPPQGQGRKLLVISSGVHGIEGFVGSAMQELFVRELLPNLDLSNMTVLLIHAVNPWGYRYKRRVSEDNVDLNRNFDTTTDLFATENEGYDELYDFLNPKGPVNLSSLGNIFSPAKMLLLVAQYGKSTLRQAILQGQYKHADGLYFGGKAFEPQRTDLEALLLQRAAGHDAVFVVDLHTGYGERGKLHLFGSTPESQKIKDAMAVIFDGFDVDTGEDSDDFYTVYGDFSVYVSKLLSEKTCVPMTFEYGTLDSQTTLGSMRSLSRMRLENQGYHYGYDAEKDRSEVEERFREMYNPYDEKYREGIMRQTAEMLPVLVGRFAEL